MARLTREESKELTRDRLRQAAVNEIATYGFSGASVERISEAAGYSRGAFYANYKNKEVLMLDAICTSNKREAESWLSQVEGVKALDDLFPVLQARFSDYITSSQRYLFMVEVQLFAYRNPEFSKQYIQELSALTDTVAEMIRLLFNKAGKTSHRDINIQSLLLRCFVSGLSILGIDADSHVQEPGQLMGMFLEDMLALGLPNGKD